MAGVMLTVGTVWDAHSRSWEAIRDTVSAMNA
jgi:hypothetical protein